MEDQVKALRTLVKLVVGQALFVGGLKGGEIADAGNWDVEVWDAFFQLCFHGKVIYG